MIVILFTRTHLRNFKKWRKWNIWITSQEGCNQFDSRPRYDCQKKMMLKLFCSYKLLSAWIIGITYFSSFNFIRTDSEVFECGIQSLEDSSSDPLYVRQYEFPWWVDINWNTNTKIGIYDESARFKVKYRIKKSDSTTEFTSFD